MGEHGIGVLDRGSPIREVREAIPRIEQAYQDLDSADRFGCYIQEDVGHVLSDEMWTRTRDWFAKHLV